MIAQLTRESKTFENPEQKICESPQSKDIEYSSHYISIRGRLAINRPWEVIYFLSTVKILLRMGLKNHAESVSETDVNDSLVFEQDSYVDMSEAMDYVTVATRSVGEKVHQTLLLESSAREDSTEGDVNESELDIGSFYTPKILVEHKTLRVHFRVIDSTHVHAIKHNAVLTALLESQSECSCIAVSADRQINGVGSVCSGGSRRVWDDMGKDKNIKISYCITIPKMPISAVTLCVGTMLCDVINKSLELLNCKMECRVKFPNDIYMDNQKIAAVLVDALSLDNTYVISFGVNLTIGSNAKNAGCILQNFHTFIDVYRLKDMIMNGLRRSMEEEWPPVEVLQQRLDEVTAGKGKKVRIYSDRNDLTQYIEAFLQKIDIARGCLVTNEGLLRGETISMLD